MITLFTGLTGSGKTWLMTKIMYKEWRKGVNTYVNFPISFSPDNEGITRYHNLDEIYNVHNGIIGIDEGQKLFDARRWGSLPISFAEKIAQHRKHLLDIYTTTQDLGHIDIRVRSNIHELYNCQSVFRFPKNERVYPILQMIRVIKKMRKFNNMERITWEKCGRQHLYLISRFFTKELYNSYADIGMQKFICKLKYHNKKWIGRIYSRDLVNRGKARL